MKTLVPTTCAAAVFLIAAAALVAQETSLPRLGPPPAVRVPLPEIDKIAGGIPLWHIPARQIPLVTVVLILPCGSVDDPDGKTGLASLTAAMLNEGAGSRGSLEFTDELDLHGAVLRASADRESSTITLQVLRRNLEPVLDLLRDELLQPRFEEKDWERVKTLWINRLKQEKDLPMAVAKSVSDRIIFGDGHPYGRPISGRIASVESITLDDVKAFHRLHWRPERAHIVAAGACTVQELKQELSTRLEGWKGQGPAPQPAAIPAFPGNFRPRFVVVDKPKAPQTYVRISTPGISRTDPRFAALALANASFGGTFTSRLITNLRETKGYTYGVSSAFGRLRGPSVFIAASSVRTEVTGESIQEFAKEFRRVPEEPFNAEEIDKARATLRSGIVESLETVSGLTGMYEDLVEAGLPPGEMQSYLEKLEKTPVADIQSAAESIISWPKATLVLVGDLAVIRKELAEIDPNGLASIAVVDAEGNPLP